MGAPRGALVKVALSNFEVTADRALGQAMWSFGGHSTSRKPEFKQEVDALFGFLEEEAITSSRRRPDITLAVRSTLRIHHAHFAVVLLRLVFRGVRRRGLVGVR